MDNNYTYNITHFDLEDLANRNFMRYEMSTYIRDLLYNFFGIRAKVKFQGSEDVGSPGYDGELFIPDDIDYSFFPNGNSVWELSNQADIKGKANSDYNKRLANADSQKTYVQATFRRWINKEEWVKEKNKDNKWKEVIALDSYDFERIFNHPRSGSARLRLLTCLGKVTTGVKFVESEWERIYSRLGEKQLLPESYLMGQTDVIANLNGFLSCSDKIKYIRNNFSSHDSKAFLLAFFIHNKEHFPSVVITDSKNVIEHLIDMEFSGVIIVDPSLKLSGETFCRCNSSNAKILFPIYSRTSIKSEILLNRTTKENFTELLQKIGFSNEEARRYTTISNCSLTCLRCFINDSFPTLSCILSEKSYTLFAVGSWDGNFHGDVNTLETLAKVPYSEIETAVMDMEQNEYPFVVGAKKKVSSYNKIGAWFFFAPYITPTFIDSFLKEAYNVLTNIDPKWDLSSDKRFAAELYGKKAKYSEAIKNGMAETLLYMMVFADRATNSKNYLISRIKGLLINIYKNLDTWQKWASVDPILPILAEAEPETFLAHLERTIALKRQLFVELFTDDKDAFNFGGCKYAGLLWGLELTSCLPQFSKRSADILMELALVDPGGTWSNRPKNSLVRIFLHWLPQIPLKIEDRISILRSIYKKHADTAISILKSIINTSTSCEIYYPKITKYELWKDNKNDYQVYYSELCNFYLEVAKNQPKEIVSLLENLGFHRGLQFKLYELLNGIDISDWNDSDRLKIWEKVRDDIWAYNQFEGNPNWQITSQGKETLRALYDKFKPKDKIILYSKYFEQGLRLSEYDDVPKDFKEREIYNRNFQKNVLKGFLEEFGLDNLLTLVESSEDTYAIVRALEDIKDLNPIFDFIPTCLNSDNLNLVNFAQLLLYHIYNVKQRFVLSYISKSTFDDITKSKILASLPYGKDIKILLDQSSNIIREKYWANLSLISIDHNSEYIEEIASELLVADRIKDLIKILWLSNKTFKIKFLCEVLVKAREEKYHEFIISHYYELIVIFKKIYSHADIRNVDKNLMIGLEISYLGLFNGHNDIEPSFLLDNIFSNPQFYIDLVKGAYKNDKMEEQSVKDSNLAEMSYRILYEIRTIPGKGEKTFDKNVYREWVYEIVKLSKAQGYFVGVKCALPQLLVHTPADETDGIWPHRVLREILEELKDPDFELNLAIAKMNARGVRSGSFKQEQNEAKHYREQASSLAITFPRTSIILNKIADDLDSYEDFFGDKF